MNNPDNNTGGVDMGRRGFLKKIGIASAGILITTGTIRKIKELLSSDGESSFENIRHEYRDNDLGWFNKNYKTIKETTSHNNKIIKDCGLDFYIAQSKDTTRSIILENLAKDYPYINQDNRYKENIYGVNITKEALNGTIKIGNKIQQRNESGKLYIPIPIQIEKRQLEYEQMGNYVIKGLKRLEEYLQKNPNISYNKAGGMYNKNLQEKLQQWLETVSETRLAAFVAALARSESAAVQDISDKGKPNQRKEFDKIGTLDFSRYEPGYNSFSYTCLHLFMEPGFEATAAKEFLGLTEGQSNHPENSVQIFLIYCMLKKIDGKNLYHYITDKEIYFTTISRARNGKNQADNDYEKKMRNNFKYIWGTATDEAKKPIGLGWKNKISQNHQ